MRNKSHWVQFFDGHAPQYLNNAFTKNTIAEVEFVLEELKLPAGSKILDMGCGPDATRWNWPGAAARSRGLTYRPGCWPWRRKPPERPVSPGWVGESARLCAHGTSHLAALGRYDVQHLWGETAGKWGRRRVELDEFETTVVARKS